MPTATPKKVLVLVGHPSKQSLCRALAEAYCEGAREGGHEAILYALSDKSFDPILHEGYREEQFLEPDLIDAQEKVKWANHVVMIYPLWVGGLPALLKGFIERVFLPGFAYSDSSDNKMPARLLKGRSIRIIITMGMPAFFYRLVYGSHSLKALKIGMLKLVGFAPIRSTILGGVDMVGDEGRKKWLAKMHDLGKQAH